MFFCVLFILEINAMHLIRVYGSYGNDWSCLWIHLSLFDWQEEENCSITCLLARGAERYWQGLLGELAPVFKEVNADNDLKNHNTSWSCSRHIYQWSLTVDLLVLICCNLVVAFCMILSTEVTFGILLSFVVPLLVLNKIPYSSSEFDS